MHKKLNRGLLFILLLLLVFTAIGCSKKDTTGDDNGNLGGNLGAVGNLVETYSGYLGLGYDMLRSSYYNINEAKTDFPIIDMSTLAAQKKYVYVDPDGTNSDRSTVIVSQSVKQYSEKIREFARVDGKIGLTGSISASFGMEHDTQTTSAQYLISMISVLTRQRELISGCENSVLATFVTSNFLQNVKDLTTTMSYEQFVDKYGTHILVDVELGGRY